MGSEEKKEFKNLDELYNYLNENNIILDYNYEYIKLFMKIKNLKISQSEVEKAQYEIDSLSFQINDNRLNPFFTTTNDKGLEEGYPSIEKNVDDEMFNYIKDRALNCKNLYLKIHYSHLVWLVGREHNFAKIAIENYLKIMDYIINNINSENIIKKNFVTKFLKNAYFLAKSMKDENLKMLKEKIANITLLSGSYPMIKFMLDEKFQKNFFDGIPQKCWETHLELIKKNNIYNAIDFLKLGFKVENKLTTNEYNWLEKEAEYWEILAKEADKNNDNSKTHFCQEALNCFKKLKNERKVEELEKLYQELKTSINVIKINTEINIENLIKQNRKDIDKILQKESDEIVMLLIFSPNILPQINLLIEETKNKKSVVEELGLAKVVIDERGNTVKHYSTKEELESLKLNENYYDYLKLKLYFINELFKSIISKDKINSNFLLNFLNKYSWYGKNLEKDINNEQIVYNWLSLLAPAIHQYFIDMQYHLINPNYHPKFILSIDSLSTKIEGLIRDLCFFIGIASFKPKKDKNGNSIDSEKDINKLLYESKLEEFIGIDDLFFLRFLLIEKVGFNLRNKVAHSLLLYDEYNINYIHLLLLALLRLAKYDFLK